MKVTLVWAKNDKNDIFTDWVNDRGIDHDCNVSQCPGDFSSPKQEHNIWWPKMNKTNIYVQQKYAL